MNIKTKLKISSIFIILFCLVILISFYTVSQKEDAFYDLHIRSEEILRDLRATNVLIQDYLINPQRDTFLKIESNLVFLKKAIADLINQHPRLRSMQQYQALGNDLDFIYAVVQQIKKIRSAKHYSQAEIISTQQNIIRLSRDVLNRTQNITVLIFGLDDQIHQTFYQTHTFIKNIVIFFLLVLIVFITVLVLSFDKTIARPLKELQLYAKEIGQKNFNPKLHISSRDEIGLLYESFNQMAKNLQKACGEISANEKKYHLAQKIVRFSTWEYDINADRFTWSDNIHTILPLRDGGPPQSKEALLSNVHPDDRKDFEDIVKDIRSPELDHFSHQNRVLWPDGTVRWIEASGGRHQDTGDHATVIGIVKDITDQKEAEQEIEKQRYYLAKAQEIGNMGTWEMDFVRNRLIWTDETYNIFGFSKDTPLSYEAFMNCVHPEDREYVDSQWKDAIQDHQPYDIKHRAIIDHKIKWIREKGEFELDQEGNCIKSIGFSQDITQMMETEAKLADSEKRLRQIIENSTNLFYAHTTDHRLTYLSPQCFNYLDCDPDEAMIHWMEFSTDNPINQIAMERTEQAIKTGQVQKPYELELQSKKGRVIWVQVNEAPVVEDGKVTAIVGSLTDITERKQVHQKLIQNYNLLNTLIEGSTLDAIYLKDKEGKYLIINAYAAKILGTPKEKILYHTDMDFLPPETAQTIMANDQKILANNRPHVFEETFTVQGEKHIFLSSKMPYYEGQPSPQGIIGISRDITERKKAQTLILENEQRFKELFDNMRSGVAIYKPVEDGNNFMFLDVNKSAEEIDHISKNAIAGKTVTEVFPEVEKFGLLDVIKKVNQTGQPQRHPAAFYQDQRISGWRDNYVYKLPSGEIVCLYEDVTKEKQAEEELYLYRQHLEKLVEQRTDEITHTNELNEKIISTIPSAVITLDPRLNILSANQQFYEIFNIPLDKNIIGSHIGQAIENITDKGKKKSSLTVRLEAFVNDATPYYFFEDAVTNKKNPREPKIFKFYISKFMKEPAADTKRRNILLAAEDITRAKTLEHQLILSERLAATGRLAASIAHEINNPLQGMSTHLDLVKNALPDNSPKLKNYEHIKSNIKRIGEIVGQLLDIYRAPTQERTDLNINQIIRQVISFVDYRSRTQGVEVVAKLSKNLPAIKGWKQQIHQVILNLVLNALESIPGKGKITIATSRENDWLVIKVQDTGKGIPKEDAKHIFDPFFSTKKESGVGLGLFVCKGLVKNHNGEILLRTKEGKGSTFTIKLQGD
jgi:PAS domain S-box-containing protein